MSSTPHTEDTLHQQQQQQQQQRRVRKSFQLRILNGIISRVFGYQNLAEHPHFGDKEGES